MAVTRRRRCSVRWPTTGAAAGSTAPSIRPRSTATWVRHHAARSGLAEEVKGLRVHSLRATAASTALREGARPEAVRDWLGHASLAATALYYRFPASERTSPTLRISYPPPGEESTDMAAF